MNGFIQMRNTKNKLMNLQACEFQDGGGKLTTVAAETKKASPDYSIFDSKGEKFR